ncbi:N-formylglutamate amidohydrolase [Xenophilus sp.]|uniref:N-formylglutamate amidohydrolase n=1 Tax=Xenophilus sp. TaxID=1873499 RepID=UPI0037DD4603
MTTPAANPSNAVQRDVPGPFAPYTLRLPEAEALPLVCDSPHSGTRYPADFGFALPFELLRKGEDTDVHVLWQALPGVGATLLAAEFPRSYIDPNREVEDIDPAMLAEPWPGPLQPSEKTRLGIGLIWRDAGKNGLNPIYQRKLSVAEVQQRIADYHAPYHAAMREQIEGAYDRFGAVWHLNLHSMPADSYESLGIRTDKPLADFVLGDRDGTTASPAFTDAVAQALRKRGFSVALNDPFKGVALIARLGRPAERRHSLQVEVHRGLYMDEATRERSAGFGALQAALTEVAQELAAFVRSELPAGSR